MSCSSLLQCNSQGNVNTQCPIISHHDNPTGTDTKNTWPSSEDALPNSSVSITPEMKLRAGALTEIWRLRVLSDQWVTTAVWCQAAQAGKGSCTTKPCIPKYAPEEIPHGFFCSVTAEFGNFLPMTYGMPHQHSATITCKISRLLAHAQGESKTWTHPQSCSLDPARTKRGMIILFAVWKCDLEARV